MAFFNLFVNYSGNAKKCSHHVQEIVRPAPECEKTSLLLEKASELRDATDLEMLSTAYEPAHQARDVSGSQTLSCAAFLDFTSEAPHADLPEVLQLMWAHLEEPEPDTSVVDAKTGGRIWYRVVLRDISGACTAGVPQRCAFQLSGCDSLNEVFF